MHIECLDMLHRVSNISFGCRRTPKGCLSSWWMICRKGKSLYDFVRVDLGIN